MERKLSQNEFYETDEAIKIETMRKNLPIFEYKQKVIDLIVENDVSFFLY